MDGRCNQSVSTLHDAVKNKPVKTGSLSEFPEERKFQAVEE